MRIEKVDGVTFKLLEGFDTTLFRRALAFQDALRNVEWMVRRSDLIAALEMQRQYFNAQDFQRAGTIGEILLANIQAETSLKINFDIANTFILLKDEEVTRTATASEYAEKLRLCESSKEIEFFFLKESVNFQQAITGSSNITKVEDCLTEKKVKAERTFLRLIKRLLYRQT